MRHNFHGHSFNFLHPGNTNKLEEYISFIILENDYRARFWNVVADDLVVDVGVDYGSYTLTALAMGAQVIAIEPRAESIANLKRNISLNPGFDERLTVIQTALDDRSRIMCFNPSAGRSSTNTIGCTESTKTQPLDDLHLHPDWIKIDTEGSEMRILRGAHQTIIKSAPNMIIEAHLKFDNQMDQKIIRFLRHLNPDYRFDIPTDIVDTIIGLRRIRVIPT